MKDNQLTYDKSLTSELTFSSQEKLTAEISSELAKSEDFILEDIYATSSRIQNKGSHKKTFSARVLDWNSTNFTAELVIDSQDNKFQVRKFPIELLQDSQLLNHGQLIRIMYFVKRQELRIVIKNGKAFIPKNTFPEEKILKDVKSKLFNFNI